jgi:hypothetical protein
MPSRIHTFPSGRRIALVARSQLRAAPAAKRTRKPKKGAPTPPTNPPAWDNSHGEKVTYQCYCNGPPWPNPVGDCYYEAAIHGSSNWTANSGAEFIADANAVASRYLVISGGDNGLSDGDMMPEWMSGIVGPNGPRRILDWMVVSAAPGSAQWQQLMWMFGGLIWTCSLCDEWLQDDSPGAVWDAGTPDPEAGHAMFETGRHSTTGPTDTRTWGITPPIQVTDAGYESADSEFIVLFSADQFNPSTGISVFSGMSWEESRQYWMAIGGKDVGPSPFTPPAPPPPVPPPLPPPLAPWSGTLIYSEGVLVGIGGPAAPLPPTPPAPAVPVPVSPPVGIPSANWPGVLDDLAQLAADVGTGDWQAVGADLGQLLADLSANPTTGQHAQLSSGLQRRVNQTRITKAGKKG